MYRLPSVMSVIFGDMAISLRSGFVTGGLAAFEAALARLRAPFADSARKKNM